MLTEPLTEGGQRFDVVHAKMLQSFPGLVERLGGDAKRLAHQVGVEIQDIAQPDSGLTYRQVLDLLEFAAAELCCPDFGMRLAKLQTTQMFGPLGLVMRNSPTFGDALDYVTRHTAAHSPAAQIWLARWPRHGAVFVGHDILLDHAPHRSQSIEHILLVGHLSAIEMTNGGARARKVYFRHPPMSSAKVYRCYFGCEVLFDQNVDGVVYSNRDLAAPITTADAGLYDAATAVIDAEFSCGRAPLHAQTRGLIMRYLGAGSCSNVQIAAELNLHPRTMLRRLREQGTSFQKIKDEVRRDLMIYYLQRTNWDLARISERLGFAEQAVMTRTCNQWFSVSPTKLRAAARPGSLNAVSQLVEIH